MKSKFASYIVVLLLLTLGLSAQAFDIGSFTESLATGTYATAAILPFLLPMGIVLRDQENEAGSSAGGAPGAEFQKKVLENVETFTKKAADIEVKFDDLDKRTKTQIEEFTKLKNAFDGRDTQVTEIGRSIERVRTMIEAERRMAYGDPIQRITRDPEKRVRVLAALKVAVAKHLGLSLEDKETKALEEMAKVRAATITGDASPGSTYFDDELATDIYDTLATYGVWNTFDARMVGRRLTKLLVKTARPSATFIAEGAAITADSTKAGTSVSQAIKGIKVLLSVSNELINDSDINIVQDVLTDFMEAISYRMDWACLQADGTDDATDGAMTGIFAGGTASVAASGNTTVETLDFEDWTKVLLAVDPAVLSRPCRWWMHPQQLIRALSVKDLNGRPIFLTALEAPTPGALGSILGFPVVPALAAPTANTTSSKIAVFGDPAGMRVNVRQDFSFAASPDAGFTEDSVAFRGVARMANKIRRSAAFGVLTTAAS